MVFDGRLTYYQDGLNISTQAMNTSLYLFGIHSTNISYYGIPGFQRTEPVITSFVEQLGEKGIDPVLDTKAGRFRQSNNPLDLAVTNQGAYFQKLSKGGSVELTRDGRIRLDAQGNLKFLDGQAILSASGTPLRLPWIPAKISDLKISPDGTIQAYDPKADKTVTLGRIGVVQANGTPLSQPDIRQGYMEDGNVYLQDEFVSLVPIRRGFEANRQMFIMQSDALSRMIQELGRTQ